MEENKENGNRIGEASSFSPNARLYLHALLESLPFDCWACDRDGRYILQNSVSLLRWGEQLGKRPQDLGLPAKILKRWLENNERALSGETVTAEVNFSHQDDGKTRSHFYEILAPIRDGEEILGLLGVNIDITAAKRSEKKRKEAEERFRLLVEGSEDHAIVMLDPEGRVSSWNIGAERQRLCNAADAEGLHFSSFYVPTDVHGGKPELELRQAEKEGVCITEDWRCRKDGSRFWARTVITALRDDDGKLRGFSEVTRDSTDEYESKQRLVASETRLTGILHSAHEGIITADEDERVLFFNPAAEHLFGCTSPAAIGKPLKDFLRQDKERAPEPGANDRLVGIRCDGTQFEAEASISQFETEADEHLYTVIVRDVTERVRSEEQRRQIEQRMQEAQRLESLGVLAGGIAHDFNNLLTGILGNANLARRSVPSFSPIQDNLDQIEKTATQAAELCQQMLAYSGKGHFVVLPLDLCALVEDSEELLRASISKKASLELELTHDLPAVLGDSGQLRQFILNLVMNASEAIGNDEGSIHISTGVLKATADDLQGTVVAPGINPGYHVWLEVRDTGCGMSAQTLAKIFEPFFSTKFPGRGLGLAAVHGIVRGHHGVLQVQSSKGKGSTFRLLLPVTDETAKSSTPEFALTPEWRGQGTVLVVDDEETVRIVTAQILESVGFHVVTAIDGADGLELFRKSPDEFDLVLLDLTMPRLDGVETHREICRLRPDTRVLLMSGYSEQEAIGRFEKAGPVSFLHKPFRSAALIDKVQEVMERD